MAQQTFALMTTKGRAKEAAALASSKSINISHIAIGSGETVPSGGETKLYREVLRKAISGNGLVAGSENTAYFDIFLSASEGPFTIREACLLDDEGDLIAIACYDPPINKPIPTSGQTVEGIIRIEVAFSNIANITIKVDPSLNVPLQRLTTTPWVPVKAIDIATPPTNPNIGDSYIIGSNSTGVWAAQEGKLTEFTQAGWAIIATPDGHGVGLPDGRVFTKVDGIYIEKIALDSQSGKWNNAVASGTANAITTVLAPNPLKYADGMLINLHVAITTTSTVPTLNVNGLGAKPIVNPNGSPLLKAALVAGARQLLTYNETIEKFLLLTTPSTGVVYGDDWIRHSDGTYEAWGFANFPDRVTQVDVSLPITFPNSINTILITDTGSGVFPGSAAALSTSKIRCNVGNYIVNQSTGATEQKNTIIKLFYRVWGF